MMSMHVDKCSVLAQGRRLHIPLPLRSLKGDKDANARAYISKKASRIGIALVDVRVVVSPMLAQVGKVVVKEILQVDEAL